MRALFRHLQYCIELKKALSGVTETTAIKAGNILVGIYAADNSIQSVPETTDTFRGNTISFIWKHIEKPEEVIFFNRDAIAENAEILLAILGSKKRGVHFGKGTEVSKTAVSFF